MCEGGGNVQMKQLSAGMASKDRNTGRCKYQTKDCGFSTVRSKQPPFGMRSSTEIPLPCCQIGRFAPTKTHCSHAAQLWRPSKSLIAALLCVSGLLCTSQDTCQPGQLRLHTMTGKQGLELGIGQPKNGGKDAAHGVAVVSLSPSPSSFAIREAGGIDREAIRRELFASLRLSEDERLKICRLEQGTEEWLLARRNRLTGSNFGAAVGHNRYKSPAALAHDMLYGTFQGNDATRWGNDHEDLACEDYCLTRRSQLEREHGGAEVHFAVTHSGLNPHPEMTWLAVSPDGHISENGDDGLLEIKCPYSQRIYPSIPPYYMDQIQGGMGVLGLAWADFCIWTPHSMQIQRVRFDRKYWEEHLQPGLERFYNTVFVPAYVEREVRRRQGDLTVPQAPR